MTKPDNKFKGSSGHFLTKALFWEHSEDPNRVKVLYTVKDEEHNGYPSLKKLYLSETDLTEYEFANKYLGGWKHWKAIKKSAWFQPLYTEWREELEVKLMSKSLYRIQVEAQNGKSSYNANKYLLEQGWIPKEKGGVGRTTKEKIRQEANKIFTSKQDVDEDYKRIMQ